MSVAEIIRKDATTAIRPRHVDPVLDVYFGETRSPSQAEIDYLLGFGTPPFALAYDGSDRQGFPVGAARIVFDGAHVFDFAEPDAADATSALIFVARDSDGNPLDLAAWAPRPDRLASHLGRAPVLGEHDLGPFQISGPPMVHRHIRGWLRSGRLGLVIVDPRRAARVLNEAPSRMVAEDGAHAAELARLLLTTVDLSRLLVVRESAA